MRFSQSIVSRIVLLFAVLLLFSVLLTGFLVYKRSSGVIDAYSRDRILHDSELASQTFHSLLDEVSTDILVIAKGPVVLNYVENPTSESARAVEELFRTFLEEKGSYFQLRLIGVEDQGREIIRLDKEAGQVKRSLSLQQKGDREYFKEALGIPKDSIYFSQIDLNEEYGEISEPKTPTLRVATPLYDHADEVLGLVVINLNLKEFYRSLRRIPGTGSELYMIDESGQYLFAPDSSLQFDRQLGHGRNFLVDFTPEVKEDFAGNGDFMPLKSRINEVVYLGHESELSYFDGKRKIRLLTVIDRDSMLKSAREVREYSLKAIALVGLIVALITLFFARYFSSFLTLITNALGNYETLDPKSIHLPVKRKDEIGVLARTFLEMKEKIDQNMDRLSTSLEQEQEAKNQRDEFLQNMSHEMRTPLNAILGLTRLLKKNAANQEQLPLIKALDRSAQSLSGLVYDVLDHQNLIEGKVLIDPKATNISALLKDIHSTYQYDAMQKGLEFDLKIEAELEGQSFLTDALRLSQIVINLVTNAIKYTASGKIVLQASVPGESKSELEIRISDTGIGIEPKNLQKINDRFFRVEEGLSGKNIGYGLGLSIVKQLTELFGGTVSAFSEMETGSTFIVRIPVEAVSSEKNSKPFDEERAVYPVFRETKRVLHIEDDLSTLDLVEALFKRSNIHFEQVADRDRAENLLKKQEFNLVISDLFLNSVNIESRLRHWKDKGYINGPLIVVSGLPQSKPWDKSVIYLEKPFDVECFKDLVFILLGTPFFSRPDFSNLYTNYDHNAQKLRQVLTLLKEEFLVYLKRIREVSASGDQEEWEGVRHKLINHINNLDLQRLRELLPDLASDLDNNMLEEIEDLFNHYQCCIRYEICRLSSQKLKQASAD